MSRERKRPEQHCTRCGTALSNPWRPRATLLCRACFDTFGPRSKASGPLPTDPPIIHHYHARAMAGLPLFTKE